MPADPLGTLKEAILITQNPALEQGMRRSVQDALDAANSSGGLAPTPRSLWVGGYEGKPTTPFGQIRSRGAPRPANWQPEALIRVDLFAYGAAYYQAANLSRAIDGFLRKLYNFEYHYVPDLIEFPDEVETNTRIQFVNTESDGIDGIDDDTNLPFMFRSYIIAYQEI